MPVDMCIFLYYIMHKYTGDMNNNTKRGNGYEKRKKDYFNVISDGMHQHFRRMRK